MIKEILKSFLKQTIETLDRMITRDDIEARESFCDIQTKRAVTHQGTFFFVNFSFLTKNQELRDKIAKALSDFTGGIDKDTFIELGGDIKARDEGD